MAKTKRDNKKGRLCTVRLNLKFQNEYLRKIETLFKDSITCQQSGAQMGVGRKNGGGGRG